MTATLPIKRIGKKFYLRKTFDGVQRRVALGTDDQRTAEKLTRQFLKTAEIFGYDSAIEELGGGQPKVKKGLDYETLSTLFRDFTLSRPKNKRPSDGTINSYLKAVEKMLGFCGVKRVDAIKPRQAYIGWQKAHPTQSESTYANCLKFAQCVFTEEARQYYKEHGWSLQNPLEGAEKPKDEYEPYKPMSAELRGKVWKSEGLDNVQKMLVRIAMGTGMRSGEIFAMRLDWINGTVIEIPCNETFTPKGKRSRSIPVTKKFVEMLMKLRGDSDSPFVVPTKSIKERRLDAQRRFVTAWLRNIGVQGQNPMHTLRKEFCSLVVMTHPNGIFAACKFAGHASVVTTEKIYGNLIKPVAVDPIGMVQKYSA